MFQFNRLINGLQNRLRFHVQLMNSRHALSKLSTDQLRDIGVTRQQAEVEAKRNPLDTDQLQGSALDKISGKIQKPHVFHA